MKNIIKINKNLKVGDRVSIPATGRAYKMVSGTITEINGDVIKVSLTGRAYKIVTRTMQSALKRDA